MMKIGKFLQWALLALIAAGVPPAYSAFWQWSKTSATNASADPTINWAEGMSPSSVNDSARAMMARAAEYRDDISGAVATAGTASAYTVTTNQGLNATPTDGQMLAITPTVTNAVAVTLTADGGNVYPIQSASGVLLGPGTLVAGTPYTMKFSAANSAWMLRDFYGNPYSIPLGGLMASTVDTAPNSNFILAANQCISRTTYAAYFSLVGTRFGVCDGVSTFGVIDMRGRLPAGLDNLNGTPANRLTSSAAGCGTTFNTVGSACGSQSQTLTIAQMPSHTHPNVLVDPGHVHGYTGTLGIDHLNSGPFAESTIPTSNLTSVGYTGMTISNGVAGQDQPHPIVPPIIGVTYFVRIL